MAIKHILMSNQFQISVIFHAALERHLSKSGGNWVFYFPANIARYPLSMPQANQTRDTFGNSPQPHPHQFEALVFPVRQKKHGRRSWRSCWQRPMGKPSVERAWVWIYNQGSSVEGNTVYIWDSIYIDENHILNGYIIIWFHNASIYMHQKSWFADASIMTSMHGLNKPWTAFHVAPLFQPKPSGHPSWCTYVQFELTLWGLSQNVCKCQGQVKM